MAKRLLIKEASKELQLSEWYLRTRAKNGSLPCLKVGNRYLFDIEQVQEFLRNEAMENVIKNEEVEEYGKLRKVK